MRCTNVIKINGREFNCGKCHACRINHTSMWTLRCLYELANWKEAVFLTLTYDDEHLPKNNSLVSDELTLFWKRLRKAMIKSGKYEVFVDDTGKSHKRAKLKYFACGEYGDTMLHYWSPGAKKPHGRPHYHAIAYGLDPFSKDDRQLVIDSWGLCDEYMFTKSKDSGYQDVTRESIQYVCGYVQKKLNGELGADIYGEALRPFCRSSQGIGLDFANQNKERLLDNGFTYLNKQKIGIPRYFLKKWEVEKSDLIDKSKNKLPQDLTKETNRLFKMFEEEMKRKGLWHPENMSMTINRFERWVNDFNFTLSRQIERDFNQLKHMRGKL